MMPNKTEQRWKLMRDYVTPDTTAPSGRTLRQLEPRYYVLEGTGDKVVWDDQYLRTHPDWFAEVTVCLTCEREVCEYNMREEGDGDPRCTGHDSTRPLCHDDYCPRCHRHEPKPEPPYPVREDDDDLFWILTDNEPCGPTSWGKRRNGLARWRTREHAETAAKAHAKTDEALMAAFNAAAAGSTANDDEVQNLAAELRDMILDVAYEVTP